ncbi:uncharacterized protein LOC18429921 isoform X2 [Amborella trichopoda]|uniref:uncharacterized protein LOC18429921 isoform X2 n=1 Tax=Amborella trichopoda TaxID=13333 RepID=UPI0009BEA6AB|nr:uncharacterized protein LOC18429921 isoform X2 [Amborella trichopoda]|eukprot:XP_020520368.1 uncharacterized protein LOC18429921 isoform X2 [Amborella trichopoda]
MVRLFYCKYMGFCEGGRYTQKMACTVIHSWTFCSLIGAFLDLSIAFFMLCGSAMAFFTAKFMGIFGLYFPCTCNGLFGDPMNSGNGHFCIQRVLVEFPPRKSSSLQMSLQNKFPYDTIWLRDIGREHDNLKIGNTSDGALGLNHKTDDESSSSASEAQTLRSSIVDETRAKSEWDMVEFRASPCQGSVSLSSKGKGVWNPRSRSSLHRRRRASGDARSSIKLSLSRSFGEGGDHSPLNSSELSRENPVESFHPSSHFKMNQSQYSGEGSDGNAMVGDMHGVSKELFSEDNNTIEEDTSFVEALVEGSLGEQGLMGNEADTIRILGKALEEERTSRTALYNELEKERSAAATAADEAMAMILRLQEEKAVIEMEARQYQRMIEEKATYDEEERSVLKEILVRREREKLVLEKEVEVYRQMLSSGTNELAVEFLGDEANELVGRRLFSHDSIDDPILILQQIGDSLSRKEKIGDNHPAEENTSQNGVQRSESIANEDPCPPEFTDGFSLEVHEKSMVSIDCSQYVFPSQHSQSEEKFVLYKLDRPHENCFLENACFPINKDTEKNNGNTRACCEDTDEGGIMKHNISCNSLDNCREEIVGQGEDSQNPQIDNESKIHDVHVITNEVLFCDEGKGGDGESHLLNPIVDISKELPLVCTSGFSKNDGSSGHSSKSQWEPGFNVSRSSLDSIRELLPSNGACGNSSFPKLRRNSMSVVDNEKLKIENEVGWLTEKLKAIDAGREKLNISLEHREREKFQLRLLEEIAHQLRAIRHLTEPKIGGRQSSLPPLSSKDNLKKRRCRSVSWGVHESV